MAYEQLQEVHPLGAEADKSISEPLNYDKPGIPARCVAGLAVANANKPLAQHTADPEPILERLRNGETVKAVAASFGVSHIALYAWLCRNAAEEFLAISAGRSLARIEAAEQTIDDATDQLGVSKGRESAKLAQWTLERANRKQFGDSKSDSGGTVVQVFIDRSCDEPHIIDVRKDDGQ